MNTMTTTTKDTLFNHLPVFETAVGQASSGRGSVDITIDNDDTSVVVATIRPENATDSIPRTVEMDGDRRINHADTLRRIFKYGETTRIEYAGKTAVLEPAQDELALA